jgi:hypothetical protein
MRALSACLTVVLGLGVAAMAACSSTSSDGTAGGGSAGAATAGTSAGGTSAGTSSGGSSTGGGTVSAAGDTGAAGAACNFGSDACTACIGMNCSDSFGACVADNNCSAGVSALQPCLCNSPMSIAECETTFIGGGATEKALADCFDAHCKADCE